MTLRASAVILVAALVAGPAGAADIGYLAPPGVPAAEFPALQRPVASIVSPTREVRRDFSMRAVKSPASSNLSPV